MKKVTIFTLAILMGCGALFAQNNFRITVGGSMPLGDFGKAKVTSDGIEQWALANYDDNHSKKGGAGMGFTIGLQGKIGFSGVEGLGATISVDGFFNWLNQDINDFYEECEDQAGTIVSENIKLNYYSVNKPKYINIAPMVGLNYQYNINDEIGIYTGFGVGANIRYITDFELDEKATNLDNYSHVTIRENLEYHSALSFAYKIGVGAIISKRFVIGIDYFNLGMSKIKGTFFGNIKEDYESENETFSFRAGKVNPMFLTLSIGVQF